MTIKEAIEYNKNLKHYMEISDKLGMGNKFAPENHEALEVAIDALKYKQSISDEMLITDYVKAWYCIKSKLEDIIELTCADEYVCTGYKALLDSMNRINDYITIKVGDVVEYKSDLFIITRISEDGKCTVLDRNGYSCQNVIKISDVHKTDLIFPEFANIIQKLKEADDTYEGYDED